MNRPCTAAFFIMIATIQSPPPSKVPLALHPLLSCETAIALSAHLVLVGGKNEQPHPSTFALRLKLDGDGHSIRETSLPISHAFDLKLGVLLDHPAMTIPAARLMRKQST
jgi:hypothetical protein